MTKKISIERILKYADFAFILIIILIVSFSLGNFVFKFVPDAVSSENRIIQEFPKPALDVSFKEKVKFVMNFPKTFDTFYTDSFTSRNSIIQTYSKFKLDKLGDSPSNQVIKGKDGWFYYNFVNFKDYYFCKKLFLDTDLDKIHNHLKLNKEKVEGFGGKYIILASPNKESIYPEFLPVEYEDKLCGETRLSQLSLYLKDKQLNFIDPSAELINKKSDKTVYFKTDSHWNSLGAKVSYDLIEKDIKQNKTNFITSQVSDYSTETKNLVLGDLSKFMSLINNKETYSQQLDYYPTTLLNIEIEEYNENFQSTNKIYDYRKLNSITANNNILNFKAANPQAKNNLKIVLFRDSFAWNMLPFFLNTFKEVYFLSSASAIKIDTEIISQIKPDFVIQQFVERKLIDTL